MPSTNSILLYVANPQASADFYSALLGLKPVELSPTFAFFALPSGLGLGLWGRGGVEPPAEASPGGCELGFPVADARIVETMHSEWQGKGARIALPPTDLDFGRTFVVLDPDGHRIRVYALADQP